VVDWANKGGATPPNVPPDFTYGYDAANNRLFERRVHQPHAPNWKGERYTYDAVYRLISRTEADLNASGALVGTPQPTQTFTLDGLGNWNSHTKDGTTYTNSLNALNQYTQFQGPQGTRDLSYDFAGNLLSEGAGGANYAYDFANRLVTFQSPGGALATYRYDALGRRIARIVGGTSLTRFIYDGDRLIEERDGSNVLVASYVFGIGSNEVLTRRRWTTPQNYADLFYHTNALGSVTAVTSTSGLRATMAAAREGKRSV